MFDCHVNAFSPFFLFTSLLVYLVGFLVLRRRREKKRSFLTYNMKMVKCHGLEIYAWFISPIFRLQKNFFYTTQITYTCGFVCVVCSTNECELLLKMAFSTVTWFYLCFKKRDTRKFVVFVVIARHMFHCSRLHNFFSGAIWFE